MEEIILEDIREKAKYIMLDEQSVKEEFIRHNTELTNNSVKSAKKELKAKVRLKNFVFALVLTVLTSQKRRRR